MKNNNIISFSLIFMFFINIELLAQTPLQTVDFETEGSGYTVTGGASPYWLRTDGSVITPDVAFAGNQGVYYFYGENTDNLSGNSGIPVYVTLNAIDVSLYTNFSIKLLVAGNNSVGSGYEGGEYLRIQYAFNGNAFTTLSQFIPKAVDIKCLTEDANADGTAEGPDLSPTFTEFTYNIPGNGTTLQIRIMCNVDQGSEEIGFDNLRIIAGSLLPVELTSFTAFLVANKVHLNWQTATEINNYGFDIERKQKNGRWEKIGFVEGHGNSNSIKEYTFIDELSQPGIYAYRLKQLDLDGNFECSGIVEVEVNNLPTEFSLSQNYPNPFNPSTSIEYSITSSEFVSLKVYDILGNEVATLVNEQKVSGNYKVNFNPASLSSGLYIYKIQIGSFNQSRKMLLLK